MIKKEKSCPICGSIFEAEMVKEVSDEVRTKKAYLQGKRDALKEMLENLKAAKYDYIAAGYNLDVEKWIKAYIKEQTE